MGIPVTTSVTKLINTVMSQRSVRVRNDGPDPVTISKDPAVTAGGSTGFTLALNAEETVELEGGQSLFAIVAATKSASVEIL